MEFQNFLNKMFVCGVDSPEKMKIYPWMVETRSNNLVMAKAARQTGVTTFIAVSALYDLLFGQRECINIITYHGGYRKKHFIDSLVTLYSWVMKEFNLEMKEIKVTDHGFYMNGKGHIEIYGLHEAQIAFRGKTKNNKMYGDLYLSDGAEDIFILMQHGFSECVLFIQGAQHNPAINKIYKKNANISDMDKVIKTLRGEYYWHTMVVPHILSSDEVEYRKASMGVERFKMEYET